MAITRYPSGYAEDTQVVKEDFVISQTSAHGFSFSNPFGAMGHFPAFYIWMVHKGHPLALGAAEGNHNWLHIYPESERKSGKPRLPAEVHADRIAYDMAALFLLPFEYAEEKGSKVKKVATLEESFRLSGTARPNYPCSIAYIEHGICPHCSDGMLVSVVTPMQVKYHLFNWLLGRHELHTYDEKESRLSESPLGTIELPRQNAREAALSLTRLLSERYDTPLFWDQIR